MAKIIEEPSRTFMEYRFHPRLSGTAHSPDQIGLGTPLVKFRKGKGPGLKLNIPFTSAVMQAVSGPDLGIALARQGGLTFIFCSQPVESQAEMVRKVKKHKSGFVESDTNLRPTDTLGQAKELTAMTGHSTIPITEDGKNDSKLLGIVTDMDYWPTDPDETPLKDIMTPFSKLHHGIEGIILKEANLILRESKKSCIPIVDNKKDRRLRYLVFKKDYIIHKQNPLELLDEDKRLIIGAGINTRDYEQRVPALVEAGVDALVVDTSDGHSSFVIDTLRWVKKNHPQVPVGAGNVVTQEGFTDLVKAEADFIKVGIGGGSICITQEQKGIGRGQATALKAVVSARDKYYKEHGVYIPVCSDGGLFQDSHILMALGFGADFVMMGRYFARFEESPPHLAEVRGQKVKPYWGEGSDRAKNWQRYHTGGKNELSFEEGVDGFVPYAGTLAKNIQKTLYVMKSTMGNLGCKDIAELHEKAVIERSSQASLRESKAHDIIFRSDDHGRYENKVW